MDNFQDNVKAGDIGISGGNAFMQRAIRFFIESPWSHSFTVVPFCGCLGAFETTESRTVIQPFGRKYQEPDWCLVARPNATEAEKLEAIKKVWARHGGAMYGHTSYLWFVYAWVCRKLGTTPGPIPNKLRAGVTCTELTADYLRNLNADFALALPSGDLSEITPQVLSTLIMRRPDLFPTFKWLTAARPA